MRRLPGEARVEDQEAQADLAGDRAGPGALDRGADKPRDRLPGEARVRLAHQAEREGAAVVLR